MKHTENYKKGTGIRHFPGMLLIILLVSSLLASCGSYAKSGAASSTAAYAMEGAYEEPAEAVEDTEEYKAEGGWYTEDAAYAEGGENTGAAAESLTEPQEESSGPETLLDGEKLVYTCDLSIQTTEYGETVRAIREKVTEYGGIIEYESETDNDYNWYYSGHRKESGTKQLTLRVRIPSKKYYDFLAETEGLGKVISKEQNVDNISREYHDVSARIEALEKEEERLQDMMDKAETIEEMILVEDRLTEVESELNSYRTRIAAMDTDVAYSTVIFSVQEVMVYTEEEAPVITFGDRLKSTAVRSWKAFLSFLEALLFALIRILPFLILIAVLFFPIRAIVKKMPKRAKKGKQGRRNYRGPGTDQRQGGYAYPPMQPANQGMQQNMQGPQAAVKDPQAAVKDPQAGAQGPQAAVKDPQPAAKKPEDADQKTQITENKTKDADQRSASGIDSDKANE